MFHTIAQSSIRKEIMYFPLGSRPDFDSRLGDDEQGLSRDSAGRKSEPPHPTDGFRQSFSLDWSAAPSRRHVARKSWHSSARLGNRTRIMRTLNGAMNPYNEENKSTALRPHIRTNMQKRDQPSWTDGPRSAQRRMG